jgi:hypothetical protein
MDLSISFNKVSPLMEPFVSQFFAVNDYSMGKQLPFFCTRSEMMLRDNEPLPNKITISYRSSDIRDKKSVTFTLLEGTQHYRLGGIRVFEIR